MIAAPCTARVRSAPRSEPACGSVRFIVPVHSPEISLGEVEPLLLGRAVMLRGVDRALVSSGQSAKPMLADFHISATAVASASGRPWPPYSGSNGSGVPAALDILRVGLAEARRRAHDAVLERAPTLVADAVERRQHRRRRAWPLPRAPHRRGRASPARSPAGPRCCSEPRDFARARNACRRAARYRSSVFLQAALCRARSPLATG